LIYDKGGVSAEQPEAVQDSKLQELVSLDHRAAGDGRGRR